MSPSWNLIKAENVTATPVSHAYSVPGSLSPCECLCSTREPACVQALPSISPCILTAPLSLKIVSHEVHLSIHRFCFDSDSRCLLFRWLLRPPFVDDNLMLVIDEHLLFISLTTQLPVALYLSRPQPSSFRTQASGQICDVSNTMHTVISCP